MKKSTIKTTDALGLLARCNKLFHPNKITDSSEINIMRRNHVGVRRIKILLESEKGTIQTPHPLLMCFIIISIIIAISFLK
jgi:hypothetical protein